MNRSVVSTAVKSVIAVSAALSLSGCFLVPIHMHGHYKADGLHPVAGASDVRVQVRVINEKRRKNLVSYRDNAYGQEFAGAYMPVATAYRQAFARALQDDGFSVVDTGGKTLKVVVRHFYLKAIADFFSAHYDGRADLVVSVINRSGLPECSYDTDINRYRFRITTVFLQQHEASASSLLSYSVNKAMSNPKLLACLASHG